MPQSLQQTGNGILDSMIELIYSIYHWNPVWVTSKLATWLNFSRNTAQTPIRRIIQWTAGELNFSQVELEVPIFTQRLSLMLLLFMGGPVAPMRRLFPDSHIEISP